MAEPGSKAGGGHEPPPLIFRRKKDIANFRSCVIFTLSSYQTNKTMRRGDITEGSLLISFL